MTDPQGNEAPPSVYPPKWHPDPFGRHSFRWYDGNKWTDQVADKGVRSVDPPTSDAIPPVPGLTATARPQKTNGTAISSLVLGILWLGGFGALLAVLCGVQAKKQIAESGEAGEGLATAGILLGVVGVLGAIAFWYGIYQTTHAVDCTYGYC